MLNCRSSAPHLSEVSKGVRHAIWNHDEAGYFDRTHRRPHQTGRGWRLPIRVALRLARFVDGPLPATHIDGCKYKKMRLGTLVTNPAVRDLTVTSSLFATLNLISEGRMELGIGRGDSSRRVRGKKPVSWSQLETAVKIFSDLTAGREIEYEGQPTRLTWAKVPPRVWIAGYGPKVLHMAGRVADGIILQFADPDLISWCMGFVREGASAAGRDADQIEVMAAAPVWVSDDLKTARERVRWFPALVSNHVMDLIRQYKPQDLPAALTAYVQDRGS